MTTELTARELWNLLPHGLHTRVLYQDQSKQDQDRIDQWFVYFDARIAAEKDLKISRLEQFEDAKSVRSDKTEMRKEISRLESELDKAAVETERLKARIAELERTATITSPKPRMTAGEKLAADLSDAWGTYEFPGNPAALQSLAIRLGYTDDPEPPSDGELLREVCVNARQGTGMWNRNAAEFRRLLAERDGVRHENS